MFTDKLLENSRRLKKLYYSWCAVLFLFSVSKKKGNVCIIYPQLGSLIYGLYTTCLLLKTLADLELLEMQTVCIHVSY